MGKIKIKTITQGEPPCPQPAPKPSRPQMRPPTDPPRPFPPPPPFFVPGPCCPSTLQVVDNIKVVSLTPDTITVEEGVVDGQKAFGVSCNASTDVIRIEAGQNVTIDAETSDKTTTYTVNADIEEFTGATDTEDGTYGTVPAPVAGDQDKYLSGDATWKDLPEPPSDFTGATTQSDGEHGLVPAPLIADKDKYLKGDGTWDEIVIPEVPNMVGATANEDGAAGIVPKPVAGDQNKFLSGDATWKDVEHTRECDEREMNEWLNSVDNEVSNG